MNKEEADLIIAEQNKSKEEILKAVAKVKSDYHELCKLKDMRIAELEKENAELKEELTKKADTNHSLVEQMADLESENAELKERIKTLEQIKREHTDYTIKVEEERTFVKDQLTKAKELIKTFCGFCSVFNSTNGSFDNLIAEAEQFLSEVENV